MRAAGRGSSFAPVVLRFLALLPPSLLPSLLHQQDHQGDTIMHYACESGNAPVLPPLLALARSLASLPSRPPLNLTPLHLAAACNHPSVLLLLLSHGASPLITDSEGWSPLLYADFAGAGTEEEEGGSEGVRGGYWNASQLNCIATHPYSPLPSLLTSLPPLQTPAPSSFSPPPPTPPSSPSSLPYSWGKSGNPPA